MIQTIRERRSINFFEPGRTLPEETLRELLEIANLAPSNLRIAAKGLGLETHPMDGFDEEAVKKEFGISEDQIIPMLVAVGYLKEGVKLLPRAFRRPMDEFTRWL